MSKMKLTIIGLYNHTDIFRDVTFPNGIDKDLAVDTILLTCGEFEPLYADAEFFQYACKSWSRKWEYAFEKWVKSAAIKYDPLNNYDRYEEYEDRREGQTEDSGTSEGVNVNDVSAYDSNTYQPKDKAATDVKTDNSGTYAEDFTHKAHLYGNIGVTTSQEMLRQEREVAEWSIYQAIADVFKTELCVAIY